MPISDELYINSHLIVTKCANPHPIQYIENIFCNTPVRAYIEYIYATMNGV